MTAAVLLVGLVVVATVALLGGLVGYAMGRTAAGQAAYDAATVERVRAESVELRGLVGRLKDLAWDHRELDPALSTILIDEIRTHEKKELGP